MESITYSKRFARSLFLAVFLGFTTTIAYSQITVAITSPLDEGTVPGNTDFDFSATASSVGTTITSIEFFPDWNEWAWNPQKIVTSAPFQTTVQLVPGSHSLHAKVTDSNGLQQTATINITASGVVNYKPIVTITSPEDGATIQAGKDFLFKATVTDQDGTIDHVQLMDGWNSVYGWITTPPFEGVFNLSAGAHEMRVKAIDNSGGETIATINITITDTPTDIQAPSIPIDLASSDISSSSFNLSWTASTDNIGIASYEVFINGISAGTTSTTSMSLTGLTASTAYAMTVKAKDVAGNISAASTTLNVTTTENTDFQSPSVPTGLVSSNITSSGFTLSWTASTDNVGVASYEVFKNGTSVGTILSTSMALNWLSTSATYIMTVKAKDAAGNVSAASTTLNVTTGTSSDLVTMTAGTNLWDFGWMPTSNYFTTGNNWSTTTNPWNSTFIDELQQAKMKCIRFMDWNQTNTSCVQNWSQRVPKTADHYNKSGISIPCFVDNYVDGTGTFGHNLVMNGTTHPGVAYEWQIDLCNRVGADIWMNVPVMATPDYVFQLATLINDQLNPSLKVYVEWGNEIWNWSQPVAPYAYQQSIALGLDKLNLGGVYCEPWWSYDVYASVRTFEQFEKVFGKNSPRLVKVIGGQIAYNWGGFNYNHMIVGQLAALANSTINPNGTTFNAWAGAPYMGGQTMADEQKSIPENVQNMQFAVNSLVGKGISVICYEGGADNYPDNNLVLTNDPAQEQNYFDYLTGMAPVCQGVFCQYCFYGGSWGLKNSMGLAASSTPKWRGWTRYFDQVINSVKDIKGTDSNISVYPNPAKNQINICIKSEVNNIASVRITDMNGKDVLNILRPIGEGLNNLPINVTELQNGIYIIKVLIGNKSSVSKMLLNR